MRTYTLDFPLHREALLNANQRLHWSKRRSRTKNLRAQAYWMARSRHVSPLPAAEITAHVSYPDNRRRDVHNLMPTLKAIVDGLVEAKVLPDDSDEYLTGPDLRSTGVPTGRPGIVHISVVITECLSRSVRATIVAGARQGGGDDLRAPAGADQ